jgi:LysM repeat protein
MNQINNMQDDEIKNLLTQAADETNPDPTFTVELERKLKQAHKPAKGMNLPSAASFFRTLGWVAVVIAVAFGLNWILGNLIPQATPGTIDYACPVTEPNGDVPPGESADASNYLGNGQLWTVLWPDGKVHMSPENRASDGSFSMKWGWWRGTTGPLTIEGHRLDAAADPLRADIPEGYGDTGFQVSGLIFPTTGCWEVTGRVGEASLTFVTDVLYNGSLPIPAPQTSNTPAATLDYEVEAGDTCGFLADKFGTTIQEIIAINGLTNSCEIMVNQVLKIPLKNGTVPTPEGDAYEWNGQTLYLNAPVPETPSEMKIYLARDEVRATEESVRALAGQFGMEGEIYQTMGELPGTTDYLVVDGNEQLRVRSDRYFLYYPDYTESMLSVFATQHPSAEAMIHDFMQSHGFDFTYKIEYSEMYGGYLMLPTSPDGFTLRHEHFKSGGFMFRFNQNGIESVNSSLMQYDEVATAAIISAEQAFQRVLNPDFSYNTGTLMGMHSGATQVSSWIRVRPLDETLTIFGFLSSTGRSVTGGAPLITLDGVTVTGNTNGISENMPNTFVEAIGQFHEADGRKTFELESWKSYEGYEEGYTGTIQREGEQIIFTENEGNEDRRLILPDFPGDLPLPAEDIYITGVTRGDVFEWKNLDNRTQGGGGGGGGGGGLGFYKINLTGTPVPLPTPAPIETSPTRLSTGERMDGMRGILTINIFTQPDGSQRYEYNFTADAGNNIHPYMKLEGANLDELNSNHNKPIRVWGVVNGTDDYRNPIIHLERFEFPYPDIQFQSLRGIQSEDNLNGQPVIFFTADDGTVYVQLTTDGDTRGWTDNTDGIPVYMQALALPDEKIGDYPALRAFAFSQETMDFDPTQIFVSEEPPLRPTVTIEKIELAYFTPDQRYLLSNPTSEPPYLQPVWRFSGHYSSGDEFEITIQALKDEFLLPDIQEIAAPG